MATKPPQPAGPEPLYARLARTLRGEIVGGQFPIGSRLPTEDAFCARFGASRHTVREALRRLREEGLVASRQGAGTVVLPPRPADPYVLHGMSIANLVDFAKGTQFVVESIKLAKLGVRLAGRLGLEPGSEWLAVRGARMVPGDPVPLCSTQYYINRDFAAVARAIGRRDGPIFALIEDLFAVSIAEVDQEIAGAALSPALAKELRARPGAIAMDVRRIYRIADGRIAQVTINTHLAARFRHAMTMRRVQG